MRQATLLLAFLGAAAVAAAAAERPACERSVAASCAIPVSATQAAVAPPATAVSGYDEDLDVEPAEPEFTVVDLPTNLRLPRHKVALRLTHRFARRLGAGSFSDLAGDLFGFDGGAQIGIGLRFGLRRGTQLALYRTSDRTIQLAAQQELLHEGARPLGLSLLASVEGTNNFGLSAGTAGAELHEFSPALSLVVSRRLGGRGAVYLVPTWVAHSRVVPSAPGDQDASLALGLGARLLVTRKLALVGEYHPRLAGYRGDLGSGDASPLATFGLEWRVGGHSFQLNVSNALATTPAQLARGAQGASGWFIGFNLTRKFY